MKFIIAVGRGEGVAMGVLYTVFHFLPSQPGPVLARLLWRQPCPTHRPQWEATGAVFDVFPFPPDSRSTAQPPYQTHTTTPCCGPVRPPDSPSAEWQTCCWGCAGAQLHASPIAGGRSSASSRSNSAQLGAVRGLRGMTLQSPD